MVATVSHQPLAEETQVLFQAVSCAGVCVCVCVYGPSETETDISPIGGFPAVVILPVPLIIFHPFTTDAL